MEIKKQILSILSEMGNCIDLDSEQDDVNLELYIVDSLQFISFILEIEGFFEIEIPDEFINMNSLNSLNSFSELIELCVSEKKNSVL